MFQPKSATGIMQGVKQFGPSVGGKKMMTWEFTHAAEAAETGIYLVWRSLKTGEDCFRVGHFSRCFCGHYGKDHDRKVNKKKQSTKCAKCSCKELHFIPRRPEECGLYHLPRRKGFNINKWRPNCKCGHNHEEHDPNYFSCNCGCYRFEGDFWCIGCEGGFDDHETLLQTESERMAEDKPIQAEFLPMADNVELQHETLKSLEVSEEVKKLAGFTDLTEEEKFIEEEFKEKMNSEGQLIKLTDDMASMDINLAVGGQKSYTRDYVSKPEKSVKYMQKKGLIKK